jgi:hypothetical protein
MSTEPSSGSGPRAPRDYAPSTVQAAGQAAESVIHGLKQQPALLALIVLNVVMLGSLFWFIGTVQEAGRTNREALMKMVERCLQHDGREDRQ